MKNKKIAVIVAVVAISCVVMAAVETLIEPTYIVKSAVKIIAFLIFPRAVIKICKIGSFSGSFRPNVKNIVGLLVLGIVIYLIVMASYFLTRNIFDYSSLIASLSEDQKVDGRSFIPVALYISVCNSFLEEYLFRYAAFIGLSSYLSRKAAYMFSSVMFALYHVAMVGSSFPWQMMCLSLLGLWVGGLVFDFVDEKSGNIYPSWAVHMFADLALMTIWYMHI